MSKGKKRKELTRIYFCCRSLSDHVRGDKEAIVSECPEKYYKIDNVLRKEDQIIISSP